MKDIIGCVIITQSICLEADLLVVTDLNTVCYYLLSTPSISYYAHILMEAKDHVKQ